VIVGAALLLLSTRWSDLTSLSLTRSGLEAELQAVEEELNKTKEDVGRTKGDVDKTKDFVKKELNRTKKDIDRNKEITEQESRKTKGELERSNEWVEQELNKMNEEIQKIKEILEQDLNKANGGIEKDQEKIKDLLAVSISPAIFDTLKRLYDAQESENPVNYYLDDPLKQQLHSLRDIGYISISYSSLDEIPKTGENLSDHVKVEKAGRDFLKSRQV